MEQRLVSTWSNVNSSVPPSYVQPLESRPGKVISPSSRAIPLIDLGGHDRAHTIIHILNASQEYGFFQVNFHTFFVYIESSSSKLLFLYINILKYSYLISIF